MRVLGIAAAGLLAGLVALPAQAERTDLLAQFRGWVVEGVTSDDDSYSCRAIVSFPGNSFSIRPLPDTSVRLQFYSEEWEFGEGDSADLQVQIDGLAPRTFSGATLLQNSVFVDLFDLKDSEAVVNEVSRGLNLHLRTAAGVDVRTYSLAGSSAAIKYLRNCEEGDVPDRNPFN